MGETIESILISGSRYCEWKCRPGKTRNGGGIVEVEPRWSDVGIRDGRKIVEREDSYYRV